MSKARAKGRGCGIAILGGLLITAFGVGTGPGWTQATSSVPSIDASALTGPMVMVPAGSFRMGDGVGGGNADEKPVHDVTVRAFQLARTPVTRGQFRRFVAATGYRTEAERGVDRSGCSVLKVSDGKFDYRTGYSWRDPNFEQGDDHPVVCVSWNDAQAYIGWLNRESHGHLRLPSEAEYEYAARAGSAAKYPWGMDPDNGCAYANGADRTPWPTGATVRWSSPIKCNDHYFYTAPVGSYQPNDFGLFDMIGNVWEWTADCYHDSYAGAPTDASNWISKSCLYRVLRGGSWLNGPATLRVSHRSWNDASARDGAGGFRLAQD